MGATYAKKLIRKREGVSSRATRQVRRYLRITIRGNSNFRLGFPEPVKGGWTVVVAQVATRKTPKGETRTFFVDQDTGKVTEVI